MSKPQMTAEVRQNFKAAKDYIKKRDINAARSALLDIELGSSFMMFHRMMAACAFVEKDYELASSHIEKAIGLSPEKQVLFADAIRIYKTKKDNKRMQDLCDLIDISKTDSSSELLRVAMAMKSLGRFGDALIALEKALRLSPDNVPIRINYGTLLALSDRVNDAMQQWGFCLKYNPKSALAMACMGRVEMHRHEFLKAIEYFKQSIDISDSPSESRKLDLAEAYVRASSGNEARDLLSKISADNNPRLHYVWGVLHQQSGDSSLAYFSINRCIEIGRSKNIADLVQLNWPAHYTNDDSVPQALKDAQPLLDKLFDPLNILRFSEHGLDPLLTEDTLNGESELI